MPRLPLVSIHNVSKSYFQDKVQTPVLHNINLEIQCGEFVSIIGPSGSGKSTLLHLIAGLDQPTHGHIDFQQQNLNKLNDTQTSLFRNKHLGLVFQDFNLIHNLTVEENIALPMYIANRSQILTTDQKMHLEEILHKLEIGHRRSFYPNQISGGQKQRTAIGRALINRPKLILADEPTGNLDSQTGEKIIELLKTINQKDQITLIIITHDLQIAKRASRIVQIKDGIISTKANTSSFTH